MSEVKTLYRSRTDRKIFGVCGGLAAYFGIDSTIIRLFALVLLFTGSGLPVYIIMALITPEEPVLEVEKE